MAPSSDKKETPSKSRKEDAKEDDPTEKDEEKPEAEEKDKADDAAVLAQEPVGPPTEKKDINLLAIVVDAIKRRQVDYDDKLITEPEFYGFRSRLIDCYIDPTPGTPPMTLEDKLKRLEQVKDGLSLSLGDYHYEQGRLQSEAAVAGVFPGGSPMGFPFFPPNPAASAAAGATPASPMSMMNPLNNPFLNPFYHHPMGGAPAGQDGLTDAQKNAGGVPGDVDTGSEQDYANPHLLRRTSSTGRGLGRGQPGHGRKWRLIGPSYHNLDLDTATQKMESIFGPFPYIRMSGTQRGIHQYKCAHPVGPNGDSACPFRLRLFPLSLAGTEDDEKTSTDAGAAEDNKASSVGDDKDNKPYDVQHHLDYRQHLHGTTTADDGIMTGAISTTTPPPKTSHPLSKPVKEFVQSMMTEAENAKTILRPAAVVQRLCEEPRFQNKPWINDSMAKSNLQEKISNFMRNHRRKEKRASLGLLDSSKSTKKSRAGMDAVHEAVQAAAEAMVGVTEVPPPSAPPAAEQADTEEASPKRGRRPTRASAKTEAV